MGSICSTHRDRFVLFDTVDEQKLTDESESLFNNRLFRAFFKVSSSAVFLRIFSNNRPHSVRNNKQQTTTPINDNHALGDG
jgi:predicted ATPase